MISFQNALPLFIFLLISFLAFYFVETLILVFLNWFLWKYCVIVVDKIMRVFIHYRSLVRMLAVGSIALIIALLFIFTSLADLLVTGNQALQLLAVLLLVTMTLIYLIGKNALSDIVIEQRAHLYIYIVLSLLAFTGIMSLARSSYAEYKAAINQAFTGALVTNIQQQYEKRLEDRLLSYFRQELRDGECADYDYATKTGQGITQFVFIRRDPNLAQANPEIRPQGYPLAGKRCVHETTFLLTPEGKWYEVLEQDSGVTVEIKN